MEAPICSALRCPDAGVAWWKARRLRLALLLLLFGTLAATSAATAGTPQTITFSAISNKTYGVAPFTVSATASSGLPVSFASLTPPVCTVSARTVTVVAAGTCTIQPSQAGDATYAAAPNVGQSFTVAKANQTITFAAISNKTIGTAPFVVSATASSGLSVTLTSTTMPVCTVSGNTVTIVALGTCTIQAAQAGNANYNAAAIVSRSFTVAKANQTITFAAISNKIIGAPPFTVSATASSGLPVTLTVTTMPVCTVSGNTVTLVAAGTCTIQASQAGNAYYNAAATVIRSFTVAKRSQTITFGALGSKTFGVPPFSVTATASSGLPVTFASTTTAVCTVSATTVTVNAGGTCTIRASQAGDAIYAAAPSVSQSFTVAKASQTITFGAWAARPLGTAPFSITATASSGLAVTFASLTTPVCTVSGTTLTLVAVGTCTIRASQAGNANYLAAPNVSQSFSVTSLTPQTIVFAALVDRVLGAAPFTVSATASSGLPVSFASLTAPVCTVSGNTVTLVAVGTCTIRGSQAGNANYAAAPNVDQSFAVGTVAPSAVQYTYDAAGNLIQIQRNP
jgi:hypothetical protein